MSYVKACRYCGRDILLAPCADGRWRTFEPTPTPPSRCTWAWRRGRGMVEDAPVPGVLLHICAERHRIRIGDLLQGVAATPRAEATA